MGKNDGMFFKAEKLAVLKKAHWKVGEGDQSCIAANPNADPSSKNQV